MRCSRTTPTRKTLTESHPAQTAGGRLGLISEDPIGFAAGDTNVARYVGNGVTGAVDPSGYIGDGNVPFSQGEPRLGYTPDRDPIVLPSQEPFDVPIPGGPGIRGEGVMDPDDAGDYAPVDGRPPVGESLYYQGDTFDMAANLTAGLGDSMSFGIGAAIRERIGINTVNYDATAYSNGGWLGIAVDVISGKIFLKGTAKGVGRGLLRDGVEVHIKFARTKKWPFIKSVGHKLIWTSDEARDLIKATHWQIFRRHEAMHVLDAIRHPVLSRWATRPFFLSSGLPWSSAPRLFLEIRAAGIEASKVWRMPSVKVVWNSMPWQQWGWDLVYTLGVVEIYNRFGPGEKEEK